MRKTLDQFEIETLYKLKEIDEGTYVKNNKIDKNYFEEVLHLIRTSRRIKSLLWDDEKEMVDQVASNLNTQELFRKLSEK